MSIHRSLQVSLAVFFFSVSSFAGAISAGGNHSLQVASDGRVWAWGSNSSGQLGVGDFFPRGIATVVPGLSSIQSVAACNFGSFALKSDGTVWAWGSNGSGALGIGTMGGFTTAPAQVVGLTSITAISCPNGGGHALALKNDGTVWAWGSNSNGQLGDGTTTNRATPFQIAGLTSIIAIGTGANHSLAVKNDGTVFAWGNNNNGQLGDATTVQKTTPVLVNGLSGVSAVSGGAAYSLALKSDHTVWAWGGNGAGQLGDGTTTNRSTPVQVQGLTTAVGIDAGNQHNLARMSDNTVRAWGFDGDGELGDNSLNNRNTPTTVGPVGVQEVSAGSSHSLVLLAADQVMGWGLSGFGALGTGRFGWEPVVEDQIDGLNGVTSVAAGQQFSLARTSDGKVWGWGLNSSGQLGLGFGAPQGNPMQVPGLSSVLGVAAGSVHSLAVKSDGSVMAWGLNGNGQVGDSTTVGRFSPVAVTGLGAGSGVIAAAGGNNHSLALKADGTVLAWGQNGNGQLGDGTNTQRTAPVPVSGLGPGSGVIAIAAGGNHSLALKSNGTVWAWGSNLNAELGDGTTTDRNVPTQVTGLTGISAISAGSSHSLALKGGVVWSWGQNIFGQLGDGTGDQQNTPVQVLTLTGVSSIAAGAQHSVAITSSGNIWAWGLNSSGQLGDASLLNSFQPVRTLFLLSGVTPVSVKASNHNLTILSDGHVAAWGQSAYGQLGNGDVLIEPTPQSRVAFGAGDLALSVTHTGTLTVGTTVVFSLTVTNVGGASVPGPTDVFAGAGVGMTVVSATGPGWTCMPVSIPLFQQCTNSGSFAPGASSTITLTATVGPDALPASIGGGAVDNAADKNELNDLAGDTLNAAAPPTDTVTLPQFTFGGGWYTAIYATNTTDSVARVQAIFYDDNGAPLMVPLAGIGTVSSTALDLAPHSTTILEALNSGSTAFQGWAELSGPEGTIGYAVFRQTVAGRDDQEAVVPLTTEGSQTAYLTYDDTAFTTAVAFLNPTTQPLTVTINTFDAAGVANGTSQMILPAHGKKAAVLRDLPGLSGILGTRGRAVFSVATGAVSVLGLRFGGSAFTSIPVAPGVATQSTTTFALPQFVFGGGWYTAIYLSNTTNAAVNVPVTFTGNDGSPLPVQLNGIGTVTNRTVALGPGATAILEAPLTNTPGEGWAEVSVPPGVTGNAVFRQTVAGRFDQEAVVEFTRENHQVFNLIYDDTAFSTAAAFLNPTSQPTTVAITARSADGTPIGTSLVVLPPHAKVATVLRTLPGLSAMVGNRGWVSFTVPTADVSVLGLRFGGAAFTSIPVF